MHLYATVTLVENSSVDFDPVFMVLAYFTVFDIWIVVWNKLSLSCVSVKILLCLNVLCNQMCISYIGPRVARWFLELECCLWIFFFLIKLLLLNTLSHLLSRHSNHILTLVTKQQLKFLATDFRISIIIWW